MEFTPYLENRRESSRLCQCGCQHALKLIQGVFHYAEGAHSVFSVALIEHHGQRHLWVSLITGEWPGTGAENCYVSAHVWLDGENRHMRIEDSSDAPFMASEVFEAYPATRDQVMAVEGAKDWFVYTYQALLSADPEMGGYVL